MREIKINLQKNKSVFSFIASSMLKCKFYSKIYIFPPDFCMHTFGDEFTWGINLLVEITRFDCRALRTKTPARSIIAIYCRNNIIICNFTEIRYLGKDRHFENFGGLHVMCFLVRGIIKHDMSHAICDACIIIKR